MDDREPRADDRELGLSREEETEVARLLRLYRRESQWCARAGANLAASVMAGAALEAALLLAVNAFPDEAHAAIAALQPKGRPPKSLQHWTLSHLLNVARVAGWLPAGLRLDDDWDHRRARAGDRAVALRQLRNYLHPAQYAAHHRGRRITAMYASFALATLGEAIDSILAKVTASLRVAERAAQGASA
jgi:hypothetical protein